MEEARVTMRRATLGEDLGGILGAGEVHHVG
jgi:hypothetical protein